MNDRLEDIARELWRAFWDDDPPCPWGTLAPGEHQLWVSITLRAGRLLAREASPN